MLGMSIDECIRKHTHRQYQVWTAWLDNEWNNPTRSDWYLMQIAREVRCVLSKSPNSIKTKQFKIPFVHERPAVDNRTDTEKRKEVAAESKRRWFSFLGIKAKP